MLARHHFISQRNQAIDQLHSDIVTIKGIMDDLALLADEQDNYFDNIESNIENIRVNTIIAENELSQANKIHRKKSKWKLLGGIGGGVGGLTALLITLGVMKKI